MVLLRVNPKIGVGVYRTPYNFSKIVKWLIDRVYRPRKDLGNKILQIDSSFEENRI